MNSISKEYDDSFQKEKREEKKCPIIMKCSCPSSIIIPTGVVNRTFTTSSLTLDTSCLCDPCIKIQYTSNLDGIFGGTIRFQVYKQCRNQFTPVPVGGSWNFTVPATGASAATAFSFFVCDCDSCNDDCCTYTVVITAVTATVGTLAVNNSTIAALAICSSNKC